MIDFNNFVIQSIAQNIQNMSDEDLQKLAFILPESVSNKFCDYLAFAVQDAQLSKNQNQLEMEIV